MDALTLALALAGAADTAAALERRFPPLAAVDARLLVLRAERDHLAAALAPYFVQGFSFENGGAYLPLCGGGHRAVQLREALRDVLRREQVWAELRARAFYLERGGLQLHWGLRYYEKQLRRLLGDDAYILGLWP